MDLTKIIQTQFSNTQLIFIISGMLFGLISIFLFNRRQHNLSFWMLVLCGFILRMVAAGFDPFLNSWDEQFHALVAKNMMTHPFKPMLYSAPVLDYDFRDWQGNHIWLHKQPWFLWQIALFFRIFGTSEFVLRLPTAIMMSLMIFIIYRIGKRISNPDIAWYGAFIYTFSFYYIHFVSGGIFTDHNDAAFIFYVSLSIWGWIEYIHTGKRRWLILIGIFAGIAMLNKWMVGLLVYSGWITAILMGHSKSEWFACFRKMTLSILCSALVAVPWQVYIFFAYPAESRYEFQFNAQHFFQPVEGHGGNWWYHFSILAEQYGGWSVYILILPGIYLLARSVGNRSYRVAIATYILVTYLFFSMAATKMPMFCAIVSPFIFLAMGAVLDKVVEFVPKYIPARLAFWMIAGILGYLAYDNLHINQLDEWHSGRQSYWKTKNEDAIIDRQVAGNLPGKDYVVFNCGGNNAIMFMYYSGTTAYGFYPTLQQYQVLKKQEIRIATFS
ncbi:MAG: glycosyltransferase family 39 protein, partial [Bacteroidota bacterium]